MPRYSLRTLLIVLAAATIAIVLAWLLGQQPTAIIGWSVIAAFFALWYCWLIHAQSLDPRKRGDHNPYSGPGGES